MSTVIDPSLLIPMSIDVERPIIYKFLAFSDGISDIFSEHTLVLEYISHSYLSMGPSLFSITSNYSDMIQKTYPLATSLLSINYVA
jgi:hypothetical protein